MDIVTGRGRDIVQFRRVFDIARAQPSKEHGEDLWVIFDKCDCVGSDHIPMLDCTWL